MGRRSPRHAPLGIFGNDETTTIEERGEDGEAFVKIVDDALGTPYAFTELLEATSAARVYTVV